MSNTTATMLAKVQYGTDQAIIHTPTASDADQNLIYENEPVGWNMTQLHWRDLFLKNDFQRELWLSRTLKLDGKPVLETECDGKQAYLHPHTRARYIESIRTNKLVTPKMEMTQEFKRPLRPN